MPARTAGEALAPVGRSSWRYRSSEPVTLTAVFTPDENGWTMARLAERPAVVTRGRSIEEAREMLLER